MSSLLRAFLAGSMVTFMLFIAAYIAATADAVALSRLLYWQGWGMQLLAPCSHVGPFSRPVCDDAPLNLIAFCSGIPLGIAIYSSLAYRLLRWPAIETSMRRVLSILPGGAALGHLGAYTPK